MQLHLSEDLHVQATTSIKNDDEEKNKHGYSDTETKEMHETIQRLLVQNAENMLIPASIQDTATETHVMHESIDKSFVQATQNAWDITIVQRKEEPHDSDIHLSKNLFNQTITSMAPDPNYKGAIGTREKYEFKGRFSGHDAQNLLGFNILYITEANETEKPIIQTTQDAHNSATIQDIVDGAQEIHDTIQFDQDTESLATARNTEQSYNSYIETQEKWDNVKKPSGPTAQNVRNSTMILDAGIDQSPSKAPELMTSSILESSAYSDKWLVDISKQNLPYLEAGLKRHPQVLDWFNTKRRRAFAALFTEVTCILRTTRRCDLTEDDRNYIKECCTALEVVNFDPSWLSYVCRCIENCGDGNEFMRKLEETEAKVSTLRNELASVEASLVSLRDEASGLHNFIEE
ncbi:hypothetical protein QN277_023317 [Acacia crassicarpa]|uniref:Uncharacterized protein n=1 Tax=Acacia crassicarpa TaxID=499986 RepID=A0AAE1JIM1_9FABA|nr:hypothetical protein QN277_023317 [Acacia crassicarpa]